MQKPRLNSWLWKIIAMIILPTALIGFPVWWKEKQSWQPYPLQAKSYVKNVTFSADGSLLVASELNEVHVWDVQNRELLNTYERPGWGALGVLSPDDVLLALDIGLGNISVRDWRAQRPLYLLSFQGEYRGGSVHYEAMAFSPDGQALFTGMDNGGLHRFDLPTRKMHTLLPGVRSGFTVAFSADGKTFARTEQGGIHLYDTQTGKKKSVVPVDGRFAIALSKDSLHVAGIGYDERVTVTDTRTKKQLFSAPAVIDRQTASVALSPDGTKVSDGYHLWNVNAGKEERALTGPKSEGVAFAPDGAVLATGSREKVELWRIN